MKGNFQVEEIFHNDEVYVFDKKDYDKALRYVASILTEDVVSSAKELKNIDVKLDSEEIYSELKQTDQDSVNALIEHILQGTRNTYGGSLYKSITIKNK